MLSEHLNNPTVVYDRVTEAWRLLLGEDLHYGYFADPTEPLAEATSRLTRHMADWLQLSPDVEVLDVAVASAILRDSSPNTMVAG
jgi:27-O-demethylrifamycin SV methyltransferase